MQPPRPLLHVPYARVMVVTFLLPVFSLFLCVGLSLLLHFDSVTATHCKVPNFIPSISAAVGGNTPERYIWRFGMAFFSFPRLFDAILLYNFFSHSPTNTKVWYQIVNKLTFLLHWLQYLGLFMLSYISSRENFLLHRNGFILFVVCSILHMICRLLVCNAVGNPLTQKELLSFRLRLVIAVAHILLFIVSLYFYWRHNTYCEPYMYSWYGLCEYLVVLTNIAFHAVQSFDFRNSYYISIAPPQRMRHND